MEFSQVEGERRGSGDSGPNLADSDSDDLYAEDVTGVLLGLVVLLAVVASVGVATALLRNI
jgi:hypothetical protein